MTLTEVVRYRVGQFLRAVTARRAISDRRLQSATAVLSPDTRRLFHRQAPQDQRHALDVYEALLEEGHTDESLLTAALLHDVGKAAVQASPWERGIFVLAKQVGLKAWKQPCHEREAREHPLVTYANHPEIGARWARQAGCSTGTVELIARHEERITTCQTKRNRLLAALQAADDAN